MTTEQTGCIYIATINGEKSYIGKTLDFPKRKQAHLYAKRDVVFHRAIRKYGADAIEWRILEDDIPEHRLGDREELWIAFYDTFYNGYNMTEGGEGGNGLKSPEARAKLSATMKDKASRGELHCQTPEWKAKVSAIHQAKVARGEHQAQNPETRAKMSATRTAQAAAGEMPLQKDPELRKRVSETWKEKSARGEHPMHDPEIRAQNAASNKTTWTLKVARGEHPMHQPETVEKVKRTYAVNKNKAQVSAGQTFLCDMTLEDVSD